MNLLLYFFNRIGCYEQLTTYTNLCYLNQKLDSSVSQSGHTLKTKASLTC